MKITINEIAYDINEKITNLLDAFVYIKEHINKGFSFNYGCRSGNCGSCSVRVNNIEMLACTTNVKEFDEIAPLIEEKRKAKAESEIKIFEKEKIRILRGPYGPYIKQGLRNYKIPKEKTEKPEDLTIEEIKAIIEEAKANPPKKVVRKKK
jgi:succinate dehydrogenase/fumarate reductase-like Fe-S protein